MWLGPLRAEAGGRQPTRGGGLAGWGDGLSPELAPGPPWLSVWVQVSGPVQRFQRHLNILEAICQSWKLFGGSKNDVNVPESVAFAKAVRCSWLPEWPEVLGKDPPGGMGVWGRSVLTAPGNTGGGAPGGASSPPSLPGLSLCSPIHPGACCSEQQTVCGRWQQEARP